MKRLLFILALVCVSTYGQNGQGQNTARMLSGTNVVTAAACPYTIQATDTTKLLVINSASSCAVTLPAATTANFGAGAIFSIKDQGAGNAVITPVSGTISGSASLTLTTGQGADIYSDGANYQAQQGAGTGGGGTPGGSPIQTQVNNSGAFGGTACETFDVLNSGPQRLKCDNIITGINPYIDIRAYGARTCNYNNKPCASGDTASITSGTNTATVSATDFINGDGIVIYGAGPSNSVTTPTGLSVSNVLAVTGTGTEINTASAAGSTTRCYKIIARDTGGGYSTASSEVCTTTGQATLGAVTVNLTSCSRSGTRVTCTTSTPHPALVGGGGEQLGEVYIGGGFGTITDASFRGFQQIDTVPDSTHFTFLNNTINTAMGATTSATGGTATFYVADALSWTAVTNAWLYYIYEGASGAETLVGVSRPSGTATVGNNDTKFEYFGSTLQGSWTFPPWIPTTPPSVAANDNLSAFVSAGGGTTTLTLVTTYGGATPANAGATVASVGVRLDAGLAIKSAAAVADQNASLYIPNDPSGNNPNEFVVNQFCDLRPYRLAIQQSGPLFLNETLAIGFNLAPIGAVRWTGGQNTAYGQNATWGGLPAVTVKEASPGVYDGGGNSITVDGVQFQSTFTNMAELFLVDGSGGAFNDKFTNSSFSTSSGSGDYMGYGLILRNMSGVWFDKVNFQTGNNGDGASHNTAMYCFGTCGDLHVKSSYLLHRGFIVNGSSGNTTMGIDDTHYNGGGTPLLTLYGSGNVQLGYGVIMDTVGHQCVALMNAKSTILNLGNNGVFNSCEPTGYTFDSPAITGGFTQLIQGFSKYNDSLMPTWYQNGQRESDQAYVVNSRFQGPGAVEVTGNDAFVVDSLPQAAPTCSVTAGGSATTGTYTFEIQPIWYNINIEGIVSPASTSCTLSSGNQTVTISWTAVAGNPFGYRVGASNGGGYAQACFVNSPATTCTINSGSVIGSPGINTLPQAGPVTATSQAVYAPAYVLGGPSAGSVTFTMPVGSGNSRLVTIPDASGLVCLNPAGCNEVYDNFNRANGGLGSNWTTVSGTTAPTITSNQVLGNTATTHQGAVWTANPITPDQFAQITIPTGGSSASAAQTVVCRGSTTAQTYYFFGFNGGTFLIDKFIAGTPTTLGSTSGTLNSGDILRFECVGSTLTGYQITNGVKTQILQVADSAIATGAPGLDIYGNVAGFQIDNWSGGAINAYAQPIIENDWMQPQHVTALTVGTTDPIAGALGFGGIYSSLWSTNSALGTDSNGKAVTITSAVTGQPLIAQNGATPAFASPGIQDGNSLAAVTTTPYTIQCDSASTLIDRAHMLRFQSGAAAVTVPLSTATGCTAGFVTSVVNDGAGTLTFSRSSPDTFSIFNGVTNTDSATSFTLANGQYATLNQGASGIWEVRIGGNALTLQTNCAVNSVSPAACGSSQTGAVVIPTTTTTYTVNTTAVDANSVILLTPRTYTGNLPSSPTCVAPAVTSAPVVSAISAGTSFTITLPSTTGQTCWNFLIID